MTTAVYQQQLIRYVKLGIFLCQYTHYNELLVHVSSLTFICLEVNVSQNFFQMLLLKWNKDTTYRSKGFDFRTLSDSMYAKPIAL